MAENPACHETGVPMRRDARPINLNLQRKQQIAARISA
jgi:hypothetical protein